MLIALASLSVLLAVLCAVSVRIALRLRGRLSAERHERAEQAGRDAMYVGGLLERVEALKESVAAHKERADAGKALAEGIRAQFETQTLRVDNLRDVVEAQRETIGILVEVDRGRQDMVRLLEEQLGVAAAREHASSRDTQH